MQEEKENIVLEEYSDSKTMAKLFKVGVRRIQQLTQDGVISTVKTPDGKRRYKTDETIQKYIEHLSDKAHGKSKSKTEAELKEQKLRAEIALKESQGELHRLRTDIAAGRYISVEQIGMDYSRFFITFKNFAMSLPNKIAGRLSGFVDPVEVRRLEKEMQGEVTKQLNSFVVSAMVDDEGSVNSGKKKD